MAATKPTLPIINYGSPLAGSPRRNLNRGFSHHNRRRRGPATAVAAILTFSLVISTFAWSSLVFSSSNALPHLIWRGKTKISWSNPRQKHVILNPPPLEAVSLNNRSKAVLTVPGPEVVTPAGEDFPLSINDIVFGIAGSAGIWHRRREFLKLWWRGEVMRGNVWLEDSVKQNSSSSVGELYSSLPTIRVSEDISQFRYTHPTGHPSGLRIARIVAESFRLGIYDDARWFFLCDDDTIVSTENLVTVLSKYDWREMVYVGGSSESHSASTYFSHGMAFGGGGIALSFSLAKALTSIQDECVDRYPTFYGSDDRLYACITELGVPLSRERGFHQVISTDLSLSPTSIFLIYYLLV